MKAVLFRDLVQEQWASIEVYADRLINGLQRLDAPDWSFVSACPHGLEWIGSSKVSLYFNRSVTYPLFALRQRADIRHVLDNSYGHLLHFINPQRTVVTSHGGTPQSWRQWNRDGPAMQFFDWTFAGTLKAARIIIVSEYSKRELIEHYDYDPARVHVVYHGVDEHFHTLGAAQRLATRSTYIATVEAGLILHVGHCAKRKNVDTLLRAFAVLLKGSVHPYRLLQIGGQFSAEQQKLIDKLNLSAHITQIPHMPNDQLVSVYNAADVFVFPSLYEGFGLPLIEAMACGIPIVCYDYELFHEVCADAALFANAQDANAFANAISRVLNDAAHAADLRKRGLERANLFSWERCARETFAVYQQLAEI